MSILINATKSGNGLSFDELYERYHQAIARRVKCFLVRDSDLMEDVCQDTWIHAWRALPETPKPCYAWLYRIATNTAISALRKKYHYWPNRAATPVLLPLSLDAIVDEACSLTRGELIEDPKDIDPAESDRVDIEQALSRLTPRQRYLLHLRGEGYKLAEIEQIIGSGQRMTWLHVDRARAAFRRAYQDWRVA